MPERPKPRRKIHPLRDALLAALCTFVVSAVGLAILYLRARDAQVDAVRIELLQLARATAAQIDGDLLGTLSSPAQQGSPEHLQLLAPLVRMHRATHDIYLRLHRRLSRWPHLLGARQRDSVPRPG